MSAPGADPLAAVRQRDVAAELVMRRKRGTYLPHDDVLAWQNLSSMLALWDTRESALRALVAQWRDNRAVSLDCCADALERLLSGPQP